MLGFIRGIAGAIEAVADFADGLAGWLRRRERDELVRKAETADDKERVLKRYRDARRARVGARLERMRVDDVADDPANRDNR